MRKLFAFIAIFLVCLSAVRVALQVEEPIKLENVLVYVSDVFGDTDEIKAVFEKFKGLEQEFSFYENEINVDDVTTYAGGGAQGGMRPDGELVNETWYIRIANYFSDLFNDVVVCFKYLIVVIELLWYFIKMIITDLVAIFKVLSYLCFGLPI